MAYRGSPSFGFGGYSFTPWVQRLLIANSVVFVLQFVVGPQLDYSFAFIPALTLSRPWTLLTYMFLHGGFGHFFFNMLGLFFFGPPVEQRIGSSAFIKLYLLSGLAGALLSFAFAFDAAVIGASGAVYGVLLAFALFWPDMPIYIWMVLPVKAKWLVAGFVVLSLFSAFGGASDGVAHFAHLGGFVGAWLYLHFGGYLRGGGLRMQTKGGNRSVVDRLRDVVPKRKQNLTVVKGGADRPTAAPPPQDPRKRRREDEQLLDDLDRVLDKISTEGMASLNAQERRILDEASRRYRQN